MVYVHAKPLAALMLQAQRGMQYALRARVAERAGLVRVSPLESMRLTAMQQCAEFDRWRAQELLKLTSAANELPAEPAQA